MALELYEKLLRDNYDTLKQYQDEDIILQIPQDN
jgi:hypothetical protein